MHLRKSRRFVLAGGSFKKQTAVSHSSTEGEIISLDADLRLEGIPALNVWDMVIDAFGTSSWETSHAEQNHKEESLTSKERTTNRQPPNAQNSRHQARLFASADNDSVIQMIIQKPEPDHGTCSANSLR